MVKTVSAVVDFRAGVVVFELRGRVDDEVVDVVIIRSVKRRRLSTIIYAHISQAEREYRVYYKWYGSKYESWKISEI